MLIVALTCWGFFKGLYDANIFASVFDVVPPEARGTAAGFMNTLRLARRRRHGADRHRRHRQRARASAPAIALASIVYVAAGVLLLVAILFFVKRDVARMQGELVS